MHTHMSNIHVLKWHGGSGNWLHFQGRRHECLPPLHRHGPCGLPLPYMSCVNTHTPACASLHTLSVYTSAPLSLCTCVPAHQCGPQTGEGLHYRLRALGQAGPCFSRQQLRELGPLQDDLADGGKLRPSCFTETKVFSYESLVWYG